MLAKRLIVALVMLLLLALSYPASAAAASWVYLERLEGTRYGSCSEYLDAASVVKDGDKVVYWTVWVLDDAAGPPGRKNIKKLMFKKEVLLTAPPKVRTLAAYQYDAADREISRYEKPGDFWELRDAEEKELVGRILEYAREGQEADAVQPDHTSTPVPKWYGTVTFADCDLKWDAHSIAAWPRDNPSMVEIIVKWVWNEKGKADRRAVLMATPFIRGTWQPDDCNRVCDKISYTVVNYRFSTRENRMRILSMADYGRDEKGRLTFFDSFEWEDIVPGSKDDVARKIALNWLAQKNSGEAAGF